MKEEEIFFHVGPKGIASRCHLCKMSWFIWFYMDVSENSGTPKSSISIGFSIINHSFWGTPIFGNPHLVLYHICEKKAGPPPKKC